MSTQHEVIAPHGDYFGGHVFHPLAGSYDRIFGCERTAAQKVADIYGESSNTQEMAQILTQLSFQVFVNSQVKEHSHIDALRLTQEEAADYRSLAGHPEKLGKLTVWAAAIAKKPELQGGGSKFGITLGEVLQFGNWDVAKELEDVMQAMPKQIQAVAPEAQIKMYPAGSARYPRKYQYTNLATPQLDPSYTDMKALPKPMLKYGCVSRMRAAADIVLGDVTLQTIKVSDALIPLDHLSEKQREALLGAGITYDGDIWTPIANSQRADPDAQVRLRKLETAGHVAGKIFEEEITRHGQGGEAIAAACRYVLLIRPDLAI